MWIPEVRESPKLELLAVVRLKNRGKLEFSGIPESLLRVFPRLVSRPLDYYRVLFRSRCRNDIPDISNAARVHCIGKHADFGCRSGRRVYT